jgi:uncharacterized protein (DUF1501 family)
MDKRFLSRRCAAGAASAAPGRRVFMQQAAACTAWLGGSAGRLALGLGAAATAATVQAQTVSDYKALVCLFLWGGADNANLLVPHTLADYGRYAAARTNLALPRASLLPFTPARQGGRSLGLHSSLAPIKDLYDRRRLAFLANVGPLVQPTTLVQYQAGSVPLPPKLFSHNDQQSVWQSFAPEGAPHGWGGRIGDLLAANNGIPGVTAITLDGYAVFLTGLQTLGARVNAWGALDVSPWLPNPDSWNGLFDSPVATEAWRRLVMEGESSASLIERDYGAVRRRGVVLNEQIGRALNGVPPLDTQFPDDRLGSQLRMVARLLLARNALQARRQVFFVGIGGWDHHSGLLNNGTGHLGLMGSVARSLSAFDAWLSSAGLANQVTTFTASEFGRTLDSNGDGSDHGWGSHAMVMGGAVRGGDVYGSMPTVDLDTGTDVGRGSLLPTTGVDQLVATLALWFGVRDADLGLVAPNIGRFGTRNLGFMG